MITCTENCVHQCDGICTLEKVGPLTNNRLRGCEFFEELQQL